jgi:Rad3-related DNA helicase
LAILDGRLSSKGYGKLFLASLPDYTVTDNVEDLVEFMKEEQPF